MKLIDEDNLSKVVKMAVKEALQEYDQERRREAIPPGAQFLTRQQTADYIGGISVKTVDAWARVGKLKRSYIKGSPRFDREWIDQSFNDLKKYKRTA